MSAFMKPPRSVPFVAKRPVWADRCDQPVLGATGNGLARVVVGQTVPGLEPRDVSLLMQPSRHAVSPDEHVIAYASLAHRRGNRTNL